VLDSSTHGRFVYYCKVDLGLSRFELESPYRNNLGPDYIRSIITIYNHTLKTNRLEWSAIKDAEKKIYLSSFYKIHTFRAGNRVEYILYIIFK
jgi:hypothetical protein